MGVSVSLLRHSARGLLALLFGSFLMLASGGAARAQCPTADNIGWGRGTTVRFFLNANLSEEQKRQVRWGLAEWTRANSVNNSRVRFEEDFTGGNFQLHVVNGSLGGNTPAFANKVFSSDGTVVSGTLTFDPNAVFAGTNTPIVNPSQPGFETMIIKLTLHEIGHTMGLDHPALPPGGICAQQDGVTVMNYICNVNDSANNMPTRVAECDQGVVNSETRYPAFTQSPNPIEESGFFVRQHYLDFLNREPDPGGLSFWTNNIESCGVNATCREARRVDTSAAFFLSIEFQETGYFVYRVYQAAFGDISAARPVPITIQEFLPETQRVGRGVVVGIGDWRGQIDANKNAFIGELMARGRFSARYPSTMSPEQFVDTLNANAGGVLSAEERNSLVQELTVAGNTTQARANVLRRVAEDPDLVQREFSPAFVLMQYFGYMRRNPDDPQDVDFRGWQFWLDKLNTFNGDWRAAQMVSSFINSLEYRRRFGQP
jgi:hypothetical protein